MTNFEKIKQEISKMTLEEYSKHFHQYLCVKIPEEHCDKYAKYEHTDCEDCKINWLKAKLNNT